MGSVGSETLERAGGRAGMGGSKACAGEAEDLQKKGGWEEKVLGERRELLFFFEFFF